ncbi:hypothetical protein [Sphingomonas bacterium]|uniref:hypothetical protein n=1 Tax=Sphingomonas bacterium TaxID=1895847 RepID=UPI0020C618BB|nr:hypothetical protein [Sphingomonas bacterium]
MAPITCDSRHAGTNTAMRPGALGGASVAIVARAWRRKIVSRRQPPRASQIRSIARSSIPPSSIPTAANSASSRVSPPTAQPTDAIIALDFSDSPPDRTIPALCHSIKTESS